jgi:PAS domain S-box-containing protein
VTSRARIDVDDVARLVANAVGDASIVRLHDPATGVLGVVAVGHREPSALERLRQRLEEDGFPPAEGWGDHVVRSGRTVRLARLGRRDQPPYPFVHEIATAMAIPLRTDDGIPGFVAAFRAPGLGARPYTLSEQLVVERLLARSLRRSGAIAARTAESEAPSGLPEPRDRLLDRSDAAVWATDLRGRTLFVTPAMAELIGLPDGDLAGLPMADFVDVPPMSLTGSVPDEPEEGDRRLLRADGTQVWLSTRSTPFVGGDGRRAGTLTTVTDVTARKSAEVALRLRLDATRRLLRMMSAVLRGDDPELLLESAVATAAELLDAWRVGVYELRADGLLELRAGHGWPAGAIGSLEPPMLRSPAGLALRSDEPVAIRDVTRWERLSLPPQEPGAELRSGCWVRIGDGRGVLAVLEREPRRFSAEQTDLLVSLAEALSVCIAAPARAARPATTDAVAADSLT